MNSSTSPFILIPIILSFEFVDEKIEIFI